MLQIFGMLPIGKFTIMDALMYDPIIKSQSTYSRDKNAMSNIAGDGMNDIFIIFQNNSMPENPTKWCLVDV